MIVAIIALLAFLGSMGICLSVDGLTPYVWLALPVGCLVLFVGICLLVFAAVWALTAGIRTDRPQEKDDPFYRRLTGFAVEFVMELLQVRLHVEGKEKLPANGRILLVCNHLHILDPLMLLHAFSRQQLAFISKKEVDDMFIVGKLMHKIMCQLINRENDREALKTILRCIQLLKEDSVSIGVFPEGYTSGDGLLHPFRSGVFKIAQKAQVPIVICTLQNTQCIFRNARHLKHTDVQLHVVDVIAPPYDRKQTAVELGNLIHSKMAQDLGPELVLSQPDGEENP